MCFMKLVNTICISLITYLCFFLIYEIEIHVVCSWRINRCLLNVQCQIFHDINLACYTYIYLKAHAGLCVLQIEVPVYALRSVRHLNVVQDSCVQVDVVRDSCVVVMDAVTFVRQRSKYAGKIFLSPYWSYLIVKVL